MAGQSRHFNKTQVKREIAEFLAGNPAQIKDYAPEKSVQTRAAKPSLNISFTNPWPEIKKILLIVISLLVLLGVLTLLDKHSVWGTKISHAIAGFIGL